MPPRITSVCAENIVNSAKNLLVIRQFRGDKSYPLYTLTKLLVQGAKKISIIVATIIIIVATVILIIFVRIGRVCCFEVLRLRSSEVLRF